MIDEGELLNKARRGDRQAFGELALYYRRNVYGLACRMTGSPDTAEELTQEVFIKAYLALERFTPYRDGGFKAWLLTITTRVCHDYYRRLRRRPLEVAWETCEQDAAITDEPGEEWAREEQKQWVRKALALLPENYRLVLVLRYQEDLDYRDIARIMDVPPGTVGTWLRRGLIMLRRNISQKGLDTNGQIAVP